MLLGRMTPFPQPNRREDNRPSKMRWLPVQDTPLLDMMAQKCQTQLMLPTARRFGKSSPRSSEINPARLLPSNQVKGQAMAEWPTKGCINNIDNNMALMAEGKLKADVYNGEQWHCDFEKYINVHMSLHLIMEGPVEHGCTGLDPRSKVWYLLDGIKTDKFNSYKTHIMSDATLQNNFDACVMFYRDFLNRPRRRCQPWAIKCPGITDQKWPKAPHSYNPAISSSPPDDHAPLQWEPFFNIETGRESLIYLTKKWHLSQARNQLKGLACDTCLHIESSTPWGMLMRMCAWHMKG